MRRSFTRVYNELKEALDKDEEKSVTKVLWKRLEDRFQQLTHIDDAIMQELRENEEVSQQEMDEEFDAIQEYRDKWNDLNSLNDQIIESAQDDSGASASHGGTTISTGGRSRYKLPKLKLVEFSGSPREWLNFWSQFKGIHEDEGLSPEEKFQYLIQSTVSESVARRVVCSFPPTADNYAKAIDHLKSRFGKEKVLVEVYVRDLLKLVLTNTNGKQRLTLASLYDQLETQLRALESLGVTSDKYAAMLYPLVESSLSEEVLVTWERIQNQRDLNATGDTDQLSELMKFLRSEVESGVRVSMAKRAVDDSEDELDGIVRKKIRTTYDPITTMDLLNKSTASKCIFCGSNHESQVCNGATRLTLTERYRKIREAAKCFKCLVGNHLARSCKANVKCLSCGGNHYKILCNSNDKRPLKEINACSAYTDFDNVILQTLLIIVHGGSKKQAVRTLIDSGSGRSYISGAAVENFGLKSIGTIQLAHSLFGGHVTKQEKHSLYTVHVSNIDGSFKKHCQLIEVKTICGQIDPTPNGPWLTELASNGIRLSDESQKECPIHILLGANIISQLYTGNLYKTISGPVAFETKFGWTLMGVTERRQIYSSESCVHLIHSMYVSTANIQDLWSLDIIGIHDPVQEKSRTDLQKSALVHFENNVSRLSDGRYEVSLPWIDGHQSVSVNREICERRLQSSLSKLENRGKVNDYQKIFDQWLTLGIIEEVVEDDEPKTGVSYLPHHPVFNDKSLTTPIRPVFDASAKSKRCPSLNDCLEKGQNLLHDIPPLLILFRMKPYAALSDIEKAFLQISVSERDRNYLRFLWYKDGRIIVLRHCRVVFGISSSPFLLAATLNHHFKGVEPEFQQTATLLQNSIYVDNCVVSVDTKKERDTFMRESTKICAEAEFNLRGWVWNDGGVIAVDVTGVGSPECGLVAGSNASQETVTSVLGLLWNVTTDTLSLDMRKFQNFDDDKVTKRKILAATHQIYDPIGIAAPVIIVPKMLLQELCKKKYKWDAPVPEGISKKFLSWRNSVNVLSTLKIPRWTGSRVGSENSLHIFTDASSKAYTAVAFVRSVIHGKVCVQLLLAKSRVATIKPMTTPRLELVACECGAKMANYLQKTVDMTRTKLYLWSDSDNALSWIKRTENWQVFVFNRVKTINQLTNAGDWRHIPGHLNPADLPSRGCSSKQLLESRWWEGPNWLKEEKEFWPKSTINGDEGTIMSERKKVVTSHLIQEQEIHSIRYFRRFSNLRKVIRIIAWMKRWRSYKRNQKHRGELTLHEEDEAEKCLWRMVQQESFANSAKMLSQMNAKKDDFGIWRIETKLLHRNDTEGFRRPILLPKDHPAVVRLVEKEHLDTNHCGADTLRSILRERFWILNSRVVTRKVTTACKRCKRHTAKKMTAPVSSLPSNRVKDAATFEVTGIDLGGPLYLLNDEKSWFVIFTCAVYRAVHLELVSSLSTQGFIQALRRFIARRGRPKVIYTDNGSNFVGTVNLMEKLNWTEIVAQTEARRIRWIFNPPSSPWWGGWWERIVGLIKQLLRKRLGRDVLDYEDMITVLCDCEQLVNTRPLTYLSEDPNELVPLSPMMFLNELTNSDVVDLDKIESTAFQKKYAHRQEIRQELRERFRKEYLSLLVHKNVRQSGYQLIKVGDVVIVETENKKRVDWPIARVVEVFPGKDGVVRSVKLRIAKNGKFSEIDRPIQRLYMLETSIEDFEDWVSEKGVELVTKKGNQNDSEVVHEEISKSIDETLESEIGVVLSADDENTNGSVAVQQKIQKSTDGIKMTRSGRKVSKPERYGN